MFGIQTVIKMEHQMKKVILLLITFLQLSSVNSYADTNPIKGLWRSNCYFESRYSRYQYIKMEFLIDELDFKLTEIRYEDKQCVQAMRTNTLTGQISFSSVTNDKIITGLVDFTFTPLNNKKYTMYERFKLTDDVLYLSFGVSKDGDDFDPRNRPSKVKKSIPYKKATTF